MDETRIQELMEALWRGREAREKTEAQLDGLRDGLRTLVDILAQKGVLAKGHTRIFEKILTRVRSGEKVALRTDIDKYAVPDLDIDCASLAHICHLRCCSLKITLSDADLDEGGIAWDLHDPYILKRRADGFCTYIDREGAGGCTIYERRPAGCRKFDCRDDKRIWTDFENKIPAPMFEGLIPATRLVRE